MGLWDFPTKPAPGPGTCRMFQADVVERFSRIHPASPFVVWLPILGVVLHRSITRGDVSAPATAAMVGAGILSWTLAEYLLHRFLFHWTEDSPRGRRIHFILHGVHHDYPMDGARLVMPLGLSLPLGALFYLAFATTLGVAIAEPFFVGFGVGYLMYDGTHFAVHHFGMGSRVGRWLKKHHMKHHHADHEGGFGVSTPLWDLVFRTMPEPAKRMGASTMARIGG